MLRLWSQIGKNISQTQSSAPHFKLRRADERAVGFDMPAAGGFFGLDYRPSDCVENGFENITVGLPKTVSLNHLKI